ncbi:MAG: sn-glycerol-3-phosphate ABC transporter ATP-binding protein UgpC [candidate division Zixibacteria bacterium]|nr:sn-glycerol-3-phosphate ABC transporter ATP-binding protein UgpC [candidate division Zixibacteria bacterium]
MAGLEFKSVYKSFGRTVVVEDLNLSIHDGELFVLLGPSGCGKSTILRLIAGLEYMDEGEIVIDGRVINNIAPKDRNVAMVFQNYALYPHMTIYDNLAFPLKVKKVSAEKIRGIVEKQASLLGLTELLERKPRTLSGGQRQRVALGRALVRDPSVFLFDEPLSNLDAKLRVSTRAEISRLQRTLEATMVYVTHDQEEALSLGDRIAILNEGRIQQIGTPEEIYDQPRNIFTASFVGSPKINLLEARIAEDRVKIGGNSGIPMADSWREALKDKTTDAIVIGIRPENIFYERKSGDDLAFQAEILHTEFAGDRHVIFCRLGESEIRVKSGKAAPSAEGEKMELFVNPQNCLLFDQKNEKRIL